MGIRIVLLIACFVGVWMPCFGNMVGPENEVVHLTLTEAIETALARNRSIKLSDNSIESSRLSLLTAESAFDLKVGPETRAGVSNGESRFGAGISMTKRLPSGPVVSVAPIVTKYPDFYAEEASVSLTVPILKGRGDEVNLDAVRNSEFSYRTARRSNYQVRVNTVISTVAAIYNIIELNDLAALYRRQVESMKQYAATSFIKKDTGLATPMDVYRAEIRLKDVEDSLTATSNSLSDAKERLKKILSMDPEKEIVVKAPQEYPRVTITLAEAIETALANRIEVEHARDMFEEAERKAIVAGKNQLPQLDLRMDYRRYRGVDEFDEILETEEDYWGINLVGSTDFKRTAEKAAYQKSLIGVRNAELDIETVNDQIVSEVKQQLEFQENAYERIAIRKDQMKQAGGKLELAKIKFKHGMADNFDIIEAEREILLAEANMMSVRTESIVGLFKLRAAMGTLIER